MDFLRLINNPDESKVEDRRMSVMPVSREEALELCKLGQGADCCIWLVMGQKGFECLYHDRNTGRNLEGETLEETWKAGKTVAKRDGCDKVRL